MGTSEGVLLVWGGDWCECVCYWCGVGTSEGVLLVWGGDWCGVGTGVSVCATGVGWGLV